jgi:hypothetical protein
MNLAPIAKAITGAVTAGCAAGVAALADGTVTSIEWLVIVSAAAAGFGAVWAVPNATGE